MSTAPHPMSPARRVDDPEDSADDYCEDLDASLRHAVVSAFRGIEGVELRSVDATTTPTLTVPECHRKQTILSVLFRVDTDGDELDIDIERIAAGLALGFSKVK